MRPTLAALSIATVGTLSAIGVTSVLQNKTTPLVLNGVQIPVTDIVDTRLLDNENAVVAYKTNRVSKRPNEILRGKSFFVEKVSDTDYKLTAYSGINFIREGADWFQIEYATSTVRELSRAQAPTYGVKRVFAQTTDSFSTDGTVDGEIRVFIANSDFATLRAQTSGTANSTQTNGDAVDLDADSGTDDYDILSRAFFVFDTDSIPDDATISAVDFKLTSNWTDNSLETRASLGETPIHVAGATNASSTALVATDFDNVLTTSFASLLIFDTWSTSTQNTFSFNASGISYINKTGTTSLSAQLGWDLDNNYTGTWANELDTQYGIRYSEYTGTASDPVLEVTYTVPNTTPPQSEIFFMTE